MQRLRRVGLRIVVVAGLLALVSVVTIPSDPVNSPYLSALTTLVVGPDALALGCGNKMCQSNGQCVHVNHFFCQGNGTRCTGGTC